MALRPRASRRDALSILPIDSLTLRSQRSLSLAKSRYRSSGDGRPPLPVLRSRLIPRSPFKGNPKGESLLSLVVPRFVWLKHGRFEVIQPRVEISHLLGHPRVEIVNGFLGRLSLVFERHPAGPCWALRPIDLPVPPELLGGPEQDHHRECSTYPFEEGWIEILVFGEKLPQEQRDPKKRGNAHDLSSTRDLAPKAGPTRLNCLQHSSQTKLTIGPPRGIKLTPRRYGGLRRMKRKMFFT